jgi:hypothetical protein
MCCEVASGVVAVRLFWLQLAFSRLVQVWEQSGYSSALGAVAGS